MPLPEGRGVGKSSPLHASGWSTSLGVGGSGLQAAPVAARRCRQGLGCGAVWLAHTVCTYNKPFGFDGLRWFVRVPETRLEGGLMWERGCEERLPDSGYTCPLL